MTAGVSAVLKSVDAPDFCIVGGMKCGTTTLRRLLRRHPDIDMPDRELFLYCMDDYRENPSFFTDADGGLSTDWMHDSRRLAEWYEGQFSGPAGCSRLRGDHTNAYLTSRRVAARLSRYGDSVKVVIVLRDPVERAISHYWHDVRKGRVGATLSGALRAGRSVYIERSCYLEGIERYIETLSADQVLCILFERLVRAPVECADRVRRFLGLDGKIAAVEAESRHNVGHYPISRTLQILANRLLSRSGWRRSRTMRPSGGGDVGVVAKVHRLFTALNCRVPSRPDIKGSTEAFLTSVLRHENRGIRDYVPEAPTAWSRLYDS